MKCNKIVSAFLAAGLFMTSQWASAQDLLTDAKQVIERATAPVTKWTAQRLAQPCKQIRKSSSLPLT